jgi:hypothetical protein
MNIKTSRRAVLAGAAALPTLAIPAMAGYPDAKLIALGERFERLYLEYIDVMFQWAPLLRAAHAEVREKLNFVEWADLPEKQNRAAARLLWQIAERNGECAASDRMSAKGDDLIPLAEAINAAPASSIGGLRAKALVVLWEVRPTLASHDGGFKFPDDGGAVRSLFYAAAALTGLTPMVQEIEVRLAADATVAEEIAA